ncbi:peptidase S41 [Acetobacter aceti]|uniref:Peptidase S41 n=1 Tax=Acetobacter aceti TaxID=435 RepID=A0A1U9KKQ8_ACEAC|nr:peptidase S41 [Acetobacter aceti]
MAPLVVAVWLLTTAVCAYAATAPEEEKDGAHAPAVPVAGQKEPAKDTTSPATDRPLGEQASEKKDSPPRLNTNLIRSVIQTALEFLQPRTLHPYDARQLCLWGLGGISALDPALRVVEVSDGIELMQGQAVVLKRPAPVAGSSRDWAVVTTDFLLAATEHSSVLESVQGDGIIQSFFDELFNHLDPYSRYVGPAPAETDRTVRSGGNAGIGITIDEQTGSPDGRSKVGSRHLVVTAVNTNGPAWPAGVDVGERLVAIDGHSIIGHSVEQVNALLSGVPGSTVAVRLYSPALKRTRTLQLRREKIPPETVFAFSAGPLVIIRITSFSSETAEEMSQYLDQATQDRHLRGILIDLRGNRGGVLQQAVTAAALLLDNGVAVVTKGRDPQANHVWAVQGGDMTNHLPVVVLVDGRTASAAEILAAALADHHRAVVVGSSTMGKGLVQTVAQLPDRGELFVTWSRVIAPLGWPLQGLGVMPQVCTSRGAADTETQMAALRSGHTPEGSFVGQSRSVRYPVPVSRILEIRKTCPAALGGDLDLDVGRDLLETPAAYRAALFMIPDEADTAGMEAE